MNWGLCESKFIRKVEIDKEKINSIIEVTNSRLEFIKKVEINKNNSSFIVEGFYEVIKELLVALLLSKGLRSRNHQCLISYFYSNYPEYEAEALLISQMSYLRNRLNYYGESIDLGFYDKNKEEFIHIIKTIKSLIK